VDHNDEYQEIIDEFVVESHENLDRLDAELVALEQDPSPETLASIFRTIHTIKGTSGFLGFGALERLTHVGEHLLSKLRDGELVVTERNTSALLQMVDAVRALLEIVARTGSDDGGPPLDDLVAELQRLQSGEPASVEPAPVEPAATFGELVVNEGLVDQGAVDDALRRQEEGDPRHIGELLVETGELAPEVVADTLQSQATKDRGASPADSVIRVDVGLLDELMNLVGELVLARNQILQFTTAAGDSLLSATSQRLNLITTELQEGVMKTRMQPIDQVWSRFPRVVRDLAVACEKRVRIEMVGRDTELDRTILEAIKDPLTHLIRNSVDHGVEAPGDRVAAGKAEEGTVLLRAFHEGGQVNIEISDDGRGLSYERIGAKAVERQLVTPAQLAGMSPREVANLIFQPGFSTAEQVTNVSGRGVGMDVVKTNIEAIGGTVDVQSEPGRGTTFRIKIPLTLAIIPALVVRCGEERYAIPQVSLLELLRIDQRETPIEEIAGTPVYRLRGELLPIVHLQEVFGAGERGEVGGGPASDDPDVASIVVVHADGRPFGLVVDEIMDTAEIVVKPLGVTLKALSVFAGATIMGDGRVALILDVPGIAGRAGIFSPAEARRDGAGEDGVDDELRRTLLLASVGSREVALLLDLVARLEEIPVDRLERAGGRLVVQYRGEIMPLIAVAESLGEPFDPEARDAVSVIVHTDERGSVGFIVDGIHDIVTQSLELERISAEPGLLGSAVVQGAVVDIVDGEALVATARPAQPRTVEEVGA
jgi:two-component system, chemotaxis family, sensor kinase CheA